MTTSIGKNGVREFRISTKILADANTSTEQALAWYYHLDETLNVPFVAKCVNQRNDSPLVEGDLVTVGNMAPEEACLTEIFVEVRMGGKVLTVPLAQLQPVEVDSKTEEAVEDWRYWVARGYKF